MSFSSNVKEEISKKNNLAKKEELRYEVIGYLLTSNCTYVNSKKYNIKYSTESDYNINRFSKILSNLQIEHDICMNGKLFVIQAKIENFEEIKIDNKEITLLNEKNIFEQKEEYKKAIVRGMFMGAGSINNPENKYHFEISFSNEKNMNFAHCLINEFNIEVKNLIIGEKYSIYIKDSEEISKMLALLGANKAIMKFEDIRIEREMRGKINRLVNCETANLTKTINASVEQVEAIEKLKKEKRFNKLNDKLKEIAELRVENPNMSLEELGQLTNPPVGKSGANYRLKKIIEIAKD